MAIPGHADKSVLPRIGVTIAGAAAIVGATATCATAAGATAATPTTCAAAAAPTPTVAAIAVPTARIASHLPGWSCRRPFHRGRLLDLRRLRHWRVASVCQRTASPER